MSVRTYRISSEEWHAGSHQICTLCERPIRNVTEIDAHPYGCECAKKFLAARGEQKPTFENVISQETVNREVHWLVKANMQAKRDEALIAIAKKYWPEPNHVHFMLDWPVEQIRKNYESCVSRNAPCAEGYRAILELKGA